MPAADFCRPVRTDRSILSPGIPDRRQISRGKLDRLPYATAESTPSALDGYGLRGQWPARPAPMPRIRFLYIGSYVCSALLSDPASRRHPCASLSLHLHQVVKGTFTPELSSMLGTPLVVPAHPLRHAAAALLIERHAFPMRARRSIRNGLTASRLSLQVAFGHPPGPYAYRRLRARASLSLARSVGRPVTTPVQSMSDCFS